MSLEAAFPGRFALRVPEFRAAFGYSPTFVNGEIAAGRLAVIGHHKSRRVTLDAIRDWMELKSAGDVPRPGRGPAPRHGVLATHRGPSGSPPPVRLRRRASREAEAPSPPSTNAA